MGRGATKAAGNVWYEARINAAKYDDRLYSRAGAAERLNMSEDAVKNTELGLEKHMSVEKAVLMADLYNAPHLLNHYCLHECPIGCSRPISDEVHSIERVTVKLLKSMKIDQIESFKNRLIDISADGQVSEDERPEMEAIIKYAKQISKEISELITIGEMALNGGGWDGR